MKGREKKMKRIKQKVKRRKSNRRNQWEGRVIRKLRGRRKGRWGGSEGDRERK